MNGVATVRYHLRDALKSGPVGISTIALHELWFGVSKSARPEENAERVRRLVLGSIDPVPFEETDAQVAGAVRMQLRQKGTPIGPYDVLIAAHAISRGAKLVTADKVEFSRVDGLDWVDWSKPA